VADRNSKGRAPAGLASRRPARAGGDPESDRERHEHLARAARKWIRSSRRPPSRTAAESVAAIEPDIRGARTIREQLDKHRDVETCATCHSKIDPPGFAWRISTSLAAGANGIDHPDKGQRAEYVKVKGESTHNETWPSSAVDASYTLENGTKFKTSTNSKPLLLNDKEQIARCLAGKLLVYSTGAGIHSLIGQ